MGPSNKRFGLEFNISMFLKKNDFTIHFDFIFVNVKIQINLIPRIHSSSEIRFSALVYVFFFSFAGFEIGNAVSWEQESICIYTMSIFFSRNVTLPFFSKDLKKIIIPISSTQRISGIPKVNVYILQTIEQGLALSKCIHLLEVH